MPDPKAVSPPRWFSAWRSAGRPARGIDPADMGTAFGLDMSMLDDTPAPPALVQRRSSWVRRLTTRRRPAG